MEAQAQSNGRNGCDTTQMELEGSCKGCCVSFGPVTHGVSEKVVISFATVCNDPVPAKNCAYQHHLLIPYVRYERKRFQIPYSGTLFWWSE